jgi:two-component system copper resistance phosphate regulon response regulator CusR
VRILIIEDEKKTANYLQKGFAEHGFTADVAIDGQAGLNAAMDSAYDMIILDIMLPEVDGWAVLSRLRQAGKDVPAILLTARDAVHDRVRGLELGADDYLVKPFAFSELLARVRTILRRTAATHPDKIQIADMEMDLVHQKVRRGGEMIELTPKEFSLLSLFARRKGETLSRDLIGREIWDMTLDTGTNVVDVHVRRLRAKIDDPFEQKLIHTVRGAGYVLRDQA